MILSDKHLASLAAQWGVAPEQINPASVDLAIGHELTKASWHREPSLKFEAQLLRSETRVGELKAHYPSTESDIEAARLRSVAALEALCRPNIQEIDLREYPEGFWLLPGEGALLHTKVELKIPVNNTGLLLLKSSRGREFWQHAFAGLFDPGFEGDGVLEVYPPVVPIRIQYEQLVAQMVLFETTEVAIPYGHEGRISHYQHQRGATRSWTQR